MVFTGNFLIMFFLSSVWVVSTERTISKKVLFGYQGWFGTNNDRHYGWRHWSRNDNIPPSADNVVVDFWPVVDEYPESSLQNTSFQFRDGKNAQLYTSSDPGVADLHFRWMNLYNLDGVFKIRHLLGCTTQKTILDFENMGILNVRQAAEKHGKLFSISWDLSSDSGEKLLEHIQKDYDVLVNQLKVTSSSSYLYEGEKPVFRIFGIGFNSDSHNFNTEQSTKVIQWLKSQGCYLVGGVPYYWRTCDHDSRPGFEEVYKLFDSISPWSVGRFGNLKGYENLFQTVVVPDKEYTDRFGISYAPVLFPGFSWSNLKNNASVFNSIPRLCGDFFQTQANKTLSLLKEQMKNGDDKSWVWLAQFDEINEGTGMYKVVSKEVDLPKTGRFVTLDIGCKESQEDDDQYLKLAEKFTESIHSLNKQKSEEN